MAQQEGFPDAALTFAQVAKAEVAAPFLLPRHLPNDYIVPGCRIFYEGRMIPVGSVVEVKRHPGWGEACVKSHWKTGDMVLNFIVFACNFGWFYEDHELVQLVDGSGCSAGEDTDSKARERRLLFLHM